jgi:hypothetical protein
MQLKKLILLAHFSVAHFFAFVVILIACTFFITTSGEFVHLKMRFFCHYFKMLHFVDGHKLASLPEQVLKPSIGSNW